MPFIGIGGIFLLQRVQIADKHTDITDGDLSIIREVYKTLQKKQK